MREFLLRTLKEEWPLAATTILCISALLGALATLYAVGRESEEMPTGAILCGEFTHWGVYIDLPESITAPIIFWQEEPGTGERSIRRGVMEVRLRGIEIEFPEDDKAQNLIETPPVKASIRPRR